ncbi:tetratricopeptide repeat protein [Candidatus Kuenenbacteria bacterium]|nr:tetratricopeptide repeat protein [Candidatus Kuenenbacteria bacterium]
MSKQTQSSKIKKYASKNNPKTVKKKVSASLYHHFNIIKSPILFFSVFFLTVFLIINIIGSQTISPLYFSVLNEDKNTTVIYLKKTMPLPFFQAELDKYKVIYGDEIEKQVFAEKYQRQQQISTLEVLLQKNPQARDVLYTLYQLYLADGKTNNAQEYLKKAQQIDPMIKNR